MMYEYITCGSFFNKFYTVLSRINFYCIAFQVQHNGYYNKYQFQKQIHNVDRTNG